MSSNARTLEHEGEDRPSKRARVDTDTLGTESKQTDDPRLDYDSGAEEESVALGESTKPTRASDLYLDTVRSTYCCGVIGFLICT